jgi:hypothetical protein
MSRETVADAFAAYRSLVLPPDAPDVLVAACQQAYAVGLSVALRRLAPRPKAETDRYCTVSGSALDPVARAADDDRATLECLLVECEAFAQETRLIGTAVLPTLDDFGLLRRQFVVEEQRPSCRRSGTHLAGCDVKPPAGDTAAR